MLSGKKNKKTYTNKAFVSGYTPTRFTVQELSRVLKSDYPFISKVTMPYKSKTWQGFAFVEFKGKEDFLKFLKLKRIRLPEFEMNLVIRPQKQGRALKNFVKDFKKRRVFVEGIPNGWTDFDLEGFFQKFGKLENAYVIKSQKGEEGESSEGVVAYMAKKDAVRCYKQERIDSGEGSWLRVEHFNKSHESHHYKEADRNTRQKKKSGGRIPTVVLKEKELKETLHCLLPTQAEYHYLFKEIHSSDKWSFQKKNVRFNRPGMKVKPGYSLWE